MEENVMVVSNDSVNTVEKVSTKISAYDCFKRLFDIIVSIIALVVLSPIFLATIIAIKLDDKGKAFYTQERIGLNGKTFKIYKFRSMCVNADEKLALLLSSDPKAREEYEINKKLRHDPRITRVGKFIRRTSIDELPQLLNVLNGTMSLIGNRPYLPREIPDMYPYYNMIVSTKPGLTGIWQVSGRSDTTFRTRCELECNYSRKHSFKTDAYIFFKTFKVVICGNGAK